MLPAQVFSFRFTQLRAEGTRKRLLPPYTASWEAGRLLTGSKEAVFYAFKRVKVIG